MDKTIKVSKVEIMKREELIKKISNLTGEKPSIIQKILRKFVIVLSELIKSGEKVTISRLGTFCIKNTKPKIGRNPKTGETVMIPERKKVSFRPTEWLRKYINSQNVS